VKSSWYRVLSIVIFLALWEIIALLISRPHILPTPVSVAVALKTLLLAPGPSGAEWAGELIGNTLISLTRVIAGFLLAALTGITLGIFMGWWRTIRDLIEPVIEILRPVPPLAWIPLALLWFGLGFKPAVFLIWLGAFFPILLNTISGLESTPKILLEAARTLGAKQSHLLLKVVIPSATPSIITGLKVGLGIGWMCLVAAELTGSSSGLGFMINYYNWTMEPANTVAGMLMIGFIGVLLLLGLNQIEKKLLFWREGVYESKG
jgi:NitT/TauT family transport system permease protein